MGMLGSLAEGAGSRATPKGSSGILPWFHICSTLEVTVYV